MAKFEITPNRSLSSRGMVLVISAFGVVLGLLALRLAWMGLWLVIPFLLLDLLAVAAAFYWIRKKNNLRESVRIDKKCLQIKHHEHRKAKSWEFDLNWVKVDLQKNAHPWQPSRLLIGSHGKWVELASFLTDDERADLSYALNRSIDEQLNHA